MVQEFYASDTFTYIMLTIFVIGLLVLGPVRMFFASILIMFLSWTMYFVLEAIVEWGQALWQWMK